MFSLSRDGKNVFLQDPAGDMAVPLVLDLSTRTINVAMPRIDELAEHYVEYHSLPELKAAATDHVLLIDSAMRFGRFYTDLFHDEATGGTVSLRSLRAMIKHHYEAISAAAARPITSIPAARDFAFT